MLKRKEFRAFILMLLILGLMSGAALVFGASKKLDFSIGIEPTLFSKVGKEWAFKINDYGISLKEYEVGLSMFISQLSAEQRQQITDVNSLKSQYLDYTIGQYIVLMKAAEEGVIQKEEVQIAIKLSAMNIIYNAYLQTHMPAQSTFMPSKEEIDAFYKQNQEQFAKMGVTDSKQIEQIATQEIASRRVQEWAQRFITSTKESSGYVIERNNDLIYKPLPNATTNTSTTKKK